MNLRIKEKTGAVLRKLKEYLGSKLTTNSTRTYRFLVFYFSVTIFFMYSATYVLFARPRGFKGDFFAAMYNPAWWDGKGIFYGPIFVFERWFVNSFPRLVTVEFFAILFLIVVILSIILLSRIIHADRVDRLFILLIFAANTFLYYSFSVAANPEVLELIFLLTMWWAISRRLSKTAYFFFAIAVMTKIVPIIFFPILLYVFTPQALLVSVFTVIGSLLVTALGQHEQLMLILKDLIPVSIVDPQPNSEQFLGLSTALARVVGIAPGGDFNTVTNIAITVVIIIFLFICYLTFAFFRKTTTTNYAIHTAYLFSAYMSLMPIMHFTNTHRHTYLFLAPIFISLKFVFFKDNNKKQAQVYFRILLVLFCTYSFLPLYFLDIFPVSKLAGIHLGETYYSYVMITEPVWTNLIVVIYIILYGFRLLRSTAESA